MAQALIDRIIADEPEVPDQADDPFTHSYFEFLNYFQTTPRIERHHVIIGANFVYGWMPTMLRFRNSDFDTAASILNRAKWNDALQENDFVTLNALVNHSMVGVSKVLHFVAPMHYAMWDSRVYRYLYGDKSKVDLNAPSTYRMYLDTCSALVAHPSFAGVQASINRKVGRVVSPLRAVELVMYTGGRRGAPNHGAAPAPIHSL